MDKKLTNAHAASRPRVSAGLAPLAVVAGLVLAPAASLATTIPDDPNLDFVIDDSTSLTVTGGETTSGSDVVTVDDTAGLAAGDAISGDGIPVGATIVSVDSASQITISGNASATDAGLDLTASAPVTPANSGTTDIKSVQVTDGSHRIIDIGAGNTLRVGETGSIRREPSPNSNQRVTVLGGSLTAGGADDTAGDVLLRAVGPDGASTRQRVGLTVSADIVDNGAGAVSVSKDGDYIVVLNGDNTYTGGTTVTSGYLRSNGTGNLGTGDVHVVGTGSADDGGVHLDGGGVYDNDFFISGVGADLYKANLAGRGAIWLGQNAEVAGTVTLTGNARVTSVGASQSEISGKITGDFELEFGSAHNTAQGTTTLSNPGNDWSGDTFMRSWHTSGGGIGIVLGDSEVIPHGPGKGDLHLGINSNNPTATLDLNGFSETINGLNSYGTTSTGAKRHIRSNAPGEVTFTLGDNDADGDFFGQILDGSGTLNLTKVGAGTQILRGDHSYSGATTVNGGTLDMAGALTGTSNVSVNPDGTFAYTNDGAALDRTVTLDGGTFQHTSTEAFAGTLIFNSGTLGGTNWAGALDGSTIGAGQSISPGTSPGQAVTDNQAWLAGGSYAFEIDDADGTAGVNWDHLLVNDTLDISSLSSSDPFVIDLISLDAFDAPGDAGNFDNTQTYDWEIVTFNDLVGSFDSNLFAVNTAGFSNDIGDGVFEVTRNGDSLYVSLVPEPSGMALVTLGAVMLIRRRRRA